MKKLFEMHEKMIRKISGRNLSLAILGKVLAILSLGSIFALDLVRYGLYILIVATAILTDYIFKNLVDWQKKKRLGYKRHIFGWMGLALLILFLGIQVTFLPFKMYILVIGIFLTIPALIDMLK